MMQNAVERARTQNFSQSFQWYQSKHTAHFSWLNCSKRVLNNEQNPFGQDNVETGT